jgi:phosphotransferase system HPr (HPr) family protein
VRPPTHEMPRSSDESRVALPLDVALHARPAGLFVREAALFGADVTVAANGKQANAKSILEVLGLGATGGTELVISASGEDAAAAVRDLAALVVALAE